MKVAGLLHALIFLIGLLLVFLSIILGKDSIGYAACLSIGCSLLASVVVLFLCEKYGTNPAEEIKFRLGALENAVCDKSIVMACQERTQIERKGYYDDLYNQADHIWICGIRLSAVIDYICSSNKHSDHWVRRLFDRKNIEVKIVILDPDCEYTVFQDSQGNLKSNIQKSMQKLKDLADKYQNNTKHVSRKYFKLLGNGSSIKFYTTKKAMSLCVSNAWNESDISNGNLLFGLRLNKEAGPLYRVRKHNDYDTYEDIQLYFNNLIRDEQPFFIWDDKKIEYRRSSHADTLPKEPRENNLRAV